MLRRAFPLHPKARAARIVLTVCLAAWLAPSGAKAVLLSHTAESVSGLILPLDAGVMVGASAGPGQPAFVSLPQGDPAGAAAVQADPTTLAIAPASPSERGLNAILEALRDDDDSSQILRANAAL